jgi:hypothetical protein
VAVRLVTEMHADRIAVRPFREPVARMLATRSLGVVWNNVTLGAAIVGVLPGRRRYTCRYRFGRQRVVCVAARPRRSLHPQRLPVLEREAARSSRAGWATRTRATCRSRVALGGADPAFPGGYVGAPERAFDAFVCRMGCDGPLETDPSICVRRLVHEGALWGASRRLLADDDRALVRARSEPATGDLA